MATLVRKQVYIRRDQDRLLKRFVRQEGCTEAELVRQALDDLAKSKGSKAAWAQEKKFIEQWIKEAARSAPAGSPRNWRREDAYDRKVFSRQ